MIGIIQKAESLNTVPPNVVTLGANAAADVLPSRIDDGRTWVYRFIQNETGAPLYVCYNYTCDVAGKSYHVILEDKQQLSIQTTGRVSCVSTLGGNVLTLEMERVRV